MMITFLRNRRADILRSLEPVNDHIDDAGLECVQSGDNVPNRISLQIWNVCSLHPELGTRIAGS